jgi:hypothetical protein
LGDPSRFRVFAKYIAAEFGPEARIADVAGGKGKLRASLHLLGYRSVTTIDTRRHLARGRRGEAYRLFDWRSEPGAYDLVVGMHPDQATDHLILFAGKHRVPAMVCPCCVLPSAAPYGGARWGYGDWLHHLKSLAAGRGLSVRHVRMPFGGRNDLLILTPK